MSSLAGTKIIKMRRAVKPELCGVCRIKETPFVGRMAVEGGKHIESYLCRVCAYEVPGAIVRYVKDGAK